MSDVSAFESQLAARFVAYAQQAPVEVDSVTLAAAIARRPRGLAFPGAWLSTRPRWLSVTLVALLVLALLASLAIGARLLLPTPGRGSLLVTDGAYECQGLQRVDPATSTVTRLLDCEDRLLISPDGIHAAARGAGGMELIDLRDGSRRILPGTEGEITTPVKWSPRGTYLHWIAGDTSSETPVAAYLGPLNDLRATVLETTVGGYGCCVTWSADESRAFFPTDQGVMLSNGDGTSAEPLGDAEVVAISPDGNEILTRTGHDMFVRDRAGHVTPVTHFPAGTNANAGSWSLDGTLAVIANTWPQEAAPDVVTSDDLWLYQPDGSSRQVHLDFGAPAADSVVFDWAPDGGHLRVGLASFSRFPDGSATGMHIVSTEDGSIVPIPGWGSSNLPVPIFSPDGIQLAAFTSAGGAELSIYALDGTPPTTVSNVSYGDWSQLIWAP